VRKRPLKKPDKELKFFPLVQAVKEVKKLEKTFLLHPEPISTEITIPVCFCKLQREGQVVVGCDGCDGWYHESCIRTEGAKSKNDWKCGFCLATPSKAGFCLWEIEKEVGAFEPKKKNSKKNVERRRRNIRKFPKALGVKWNDDKNKGTFTSGYRSWDDLVEDFKKNGKRTREKIHAMKDKLGDMIQDPLHHVTDEQTLGGVKPRAVSNELLEELEDEVLDLMEADDDDSEDDDSDSDN